MRLALILLTTAAVIFGGYWVFAAQMIERQSTALLARSPLIEGRPGTVSGFPLRFRSTVERLEWRSRDGLRAWHADVIALEAASYQPTHITLRFPAEQDIGLGGLTSVLKTADMQGELTVGTDLTLRAANLTLNDGQMDPPLFFATLSHANLDLQRIEGATYALNLNADALHLAPALLTVIDPDDTLPDEVDTLQLFAELTFAAPVAATGALPDLSSLQLNTAQLDWGPLQMHADGQIIRSEGGTLDGQIALQMEDWRPFHALLVATGALPQDAAMMAGLFLASQAHPGGNAVTLPLDVRASVLSFGPFALMRLPAL